MLLPTVLHPQRKWKINLACSSAPHTVNARWRDHSLQPQSEKQNIKRVYRIFASCARFLYVKHARETLSLETSGLGDFQMKQSSNAWAHMELDVAHHCFTSTEKMKNQSCVARPNQKDMHASVCVYWDMVSAKKKNNSTCAAATRMDKNTSSPCRDSVSLHRILSTHCDIPRHRLQTLHPNSPLQLQESPSPFHTHPMDTYWWDTCWTDAYWCFFFEPLPHSHESSDGQKCL